MSAEIARLRSQLEKGEVVKQSVEYELMKVRKELATERQLRIQHATESSKTIEDLQRMLNVIDEQVRLHVATLAWYSRELCFKISRTWKVLENEISPGNLCARSWKVLEFAMR